MARKKKENIDTANDGKKPDDLSPESSPVTETASTPEVIPPVIISTDTKQEPEPETITEPQTTETVKTKRRISSRMIFLSISCLMTVIGLGLFIAYFITTNMGLAFPGVLLLFVGAIGVWYFWKTEGELIVTHTEFSGAPVPTEQVNSLVLYADMISFENTKELGGYPWECKNDHKKYYVFESANRFEDEDRVKKPFTLPDFKYYDPRVLARRVLNLPAHRKLFTRREKLGQYIKTGLLVVTIVILWIVILTTTAPGG